MNNKYTGKILMSAAAAAATLAIFASLLPAGEAPTTAAHVADPDVSPSAVSAASSLAFASSAGTARPSAGAQASPAGAAPVFELEAEAAGKVAVTADRATGGTSMVRVDRGGDLYPQGAGLSPEDKLVSFLERHGAVFGIDDPAAQLRMIGVRDDQYGNALLSYQQMHGDVPVFGAEMRGHVSQDGRLTAVNGKFVPGITLPETPVIERDRAARAAVAVVSQQVTSKVKPSDLTVASSSVVVYRENLTKGVSGDNHLAYQVEVTHAGAVREFVYVDALTGKVVDQVTGTHTLKNRIVHEGNIAAPPAWTEGDPRPAPQPAHEDEIAGAGYAYNIFFNLSGGTYRSWDGNDATMITVNNDPTIVCPNANWNGTSTNYCSGTSSDDVVVHEWAHAYTQETSGLIYSYQSGALNESYSDIFGEVVDLINNREGVEGTAATGNNGPRSQDESVCSEFTSELPTGDQSIRWLIGEDAFAFTGLPAFGDAAIRDMWNPGCAAGALFFGDPGHVSSERYHCEASDAGGVHVNSAINNRAFAFLVDGNTLDLKDDGTPFANPVTVNGIGITKAAHIFWRANSVYNTPSSSFNDNADALEMACADLVGVNLTKLVTDAEVGSGMLGANEDTIDPIPELSGEVITAADCAEVTNAIAAVEMRNDVAQQCGFVAPLDLTPAPMCEGATVNTIYSEDWESGSDGWLVGIERANNIATVDTLPWRLRSSAESPTLPEGQTGTVMFQENRRDYGNCADDDESAVEFLESPPITVDADGSQLVFEHYFITEATYDGGNVLINVNNEVDLLGNTVWTIIPAGAFIHNPYNSQLQGVADQNTNPKAGEPSFDGSNPIDGSNVWGQSQIDLEHPALGVTNGDTVRLRWEFGQDGCNGVDGWYVDNVEVFSCANDAPPPLCQTYDADVDIVNGQIVSDLGLGLTGSVTTAQVSGQSSVFDVNVVNLKGTTNYSGDLDFTLTSPAGTTIRLDDDDDCALEQKPGFDVNFDDDGAAPVGCNDWNSGGIFQPLDPLASFAGENANGAWTLTVTDSFPDLIVPDSVSEWGLEFCREPVQNDAPTAVDDSASTTRNNPVTVNVLVNDSDPENGPLIVDSVTTPANGQATINADDTITYQPDQGFVGTDSFDYTIEDDHGDQASATVTISVTRGDDDDFDDDGISDDDDSDDDNDGRRDDDDSDDDNDGISDDDDSDDDNDGIDDDHDSKSTDDNAQSQSARTSPGGKDRFMIVADQATVAVVASIRGTATDLVTIEVFDPNGVLVGTSVPTPRGPLVVVPSAIAGAYSIEVTNMRAEPIDYTLSMTTQRFRP